VSRAITVSDEDWERVQDGMRIASFDLNGLMLHAIAIAVTSASGEQRAVHDANEGYLTDLYALAMPGTPFLTIDIDGQAHVVYAEPSC
jgi:hypothetical protein